MTGSAMREIRKRFDPGLSNFKIVYGCYVNAAREIVATMKIPILDMDSEEREMYADLFRATISGPDGRHLHDIQIDTEDSDEYRLLLALRESSLEDESLRSLLYERIIDSYDNDGKSYAIILTTETYDLLPKYNDTEDWSEVAERQFKYFVCSICKVKDPKAALRYAKEPREFRGSSTGSLLADPMHGFMFPAFVDRQADIHAATYYTKKVDDVHGELVQAIFAASESPMAASTRKEIFSDSLAAALEEDLSLSVMAAVQAGIAEMVAADEEGDTNPDIPLEVVGAILKDLDIADEKIERFLSASSEKLEGKDCVSAATILKSKYTVSTPDTEITTTPTNAPKIRAKRIDGVLYILVPAGEAVLVNGRIISVENIE